MKRKSARRSPVAPDTPRIGDDVAKRRTGRGWNAWFARLDRAGAAKLDHRGIVALVAREAPELGGWWQQEVAVAYELSRGLRQRHQKPGGFEASASRTIGVPVGRLFAAWTDKRVRSRWLDATLVVHKATAPKSLRATWKGAKCVSVNFYRKGPGKSQVALQHGRLPDAKSVERMQRFWRGKLSALAVSLSPRTGT